MQNEFDLEKIEAYLFGQISTSDAALIEEKILTDSNFAHQVRVLEAVVNGVRLNSIQIIANKLEKSKQINNFEEHLDGIEKECEDNVAKSIKKAVNLNALKLERERVVKYMDSSLSAKTFEKIEREKALTYSINKVGRSNLKKFLYISAVAALIFVIILAIPFSITFDNERIAIFDTPKIEEQPQFDTEDPNKENTKTNENEIKAFTDTNAIASKAEKKVYWDKGVLKAYNEPIAVVEPKIDPKFVVVPQEYNSEANSYILPKTVPNDAKTGKPYVKGTPVYKAFIDANTIAAKADGRRLYWDNGVLKVYKEKIDIEKLFIDNFKPQTELKAEDFESIYAQKTDFFAIKQGLEEFKKGNFKIAISLLERNRLYIIDSTIKKEEINLIIAQSYLALNITKAAIVQLEEIDKRIRTYNITLLQELEFLESVFNRLKRTDSVLFIEKMEAKESCYVDIYKFKNLSMRVKWYLALAYLKNSKIEEAINFLESINSGELERKATELLNILKK